MQETILVVDDEKEIADLVELYLRNENYRVLKCYNGSDALQQLNQPISLAILDVMLPDIDGFALCQKIRQDHFFPIIMLTARVEELDKITGLTLGADDYITKPFQPLELVARVKTQLRRYTRYNQTQWEPKRQEIALGGLYICRDNHKCTLNDTVLALTPLEFEILWYLCSHQGQVVSSETLFEAVWGEKYLENNNNTVMAHVARLREKMQEPPRKPKYIKTVWGWAIPLAKYFTLAQQRHQVRLSRRLFVRYLLSLLGMVSGYFALALLFVVIYATFRLGNIVPARMFYEYLSFHREDISILVLFFGWPFLTYRCIYQALSYLDALVAASEQMVQQPEQTVELPPDLSAIQTELNLVREQTFA